jgi:hypothetical protein
MAEADGHVAGYAGAIFRDTTIKPLLSVQCDDPSVSKCCVFGPAKRTVALRATAKRGDQEHHQPGETDGGTAMHLP